MSLRTTLGPWAFWIIGVLWLPLLVVGYLLFIVRWSMYTRRTGTSGTMLASFLMRWTQHRLGVRRDLPCARMMRVLPNVSQPGFRLMMAPTLMAHDLTGYVPRSLHYPYQGVPPMKDQPAARTTFFDAALARHLPTVDQVVILGAGLDTRCYQLPAGTAVRCFEIDTPKAQRLKRAMLAKAGIDATGVTFVTADFEQEDWYTKLLAAGFDPQRPAFFLWESVTMYLDREAVERTLRTIAGLAPGTAVAFDYFSTEHLESRSASMRYVRAILDAVGEPFGTFGLGTTPPARAQAAAFVESCGLALEEHGNVGAESHGKHPEGGFIVATVPPSA